ncbi:MAG TPA: DUF3536 domain-containing protein [Saprospiraceae bacterium]|nr:DUF3536 domain-containing protein [Saprospiraceae bacterium]
MNKYICIHGHFYQPPRENAWLEYIERQESARPFHDWNERINFECYAPNTSARILNNQGEIIKIVNNYSCISFNFGPTLLSWMERKDKETYHAILKADQQSIKQYGEHGSAIAQAYNHTILPLSNRRDKETQVIWGIQDFESRFKRKPEGMWLPETAVDTETLEILADHGIKFTILAPRQAKAIRKIGDNNWEETNTEKLDTKRPYLFKIPHTDKSIVLFFYNGPLSQEVAFKGILNSGKKFADKLSQGFSGDKPQLVHIATDGESYGHHHKYGEMALAAALHSLRQRKDVSLTNYGQFLALFPPEYEAQIHENSSWSCVHGVERWRNDCGCNAGHEGWNQLWRKPLRDALDDIRDQFIEIFEQEGKKYFEDPWQTRNDYYQVIRNREDDNVNSFLEKHCKGKCLDQTNALRLLEMQRHAMLMYTSCGWFFDEITGIETTQILQYAGRAIQYAEQVTGQKIQDRFIENLKKAPSNIYENGAHDYLTHLMPNTIGFKRMAMHFATTSVFERQPQANPLYVYEVVREQADRFDAGIQRLSVGKLRLRSKIIHQEKSFCYAVLYLGQQNIIGSLSDEMPDDVFDVMKEKLVEAFRKPNIGQVFSLMNTYFNGERFSIWELFTDEKQRILNDMLFKSMKNASGNLQEIYQDNYQLMLALKNEGMHIPEAFQTAAEFVINRALIDFFKKENLHFEKLQQLSKELKRWNTRISNEPEFDLLAGERIYHEVQKITLSHASHIQMTNLLNIVATLDEMGIKPNLWKSQNVFFKMVQGLKNRNWDYHSEEWKASFIKLGHYLKVSI